MTCALAPCDLRCEFLTDPLGIDVLSPRLSWRSEAGANGARQSAWRIIAGPSPTALAEGNAALWDSGKVLGEDSQHIHYGGRALGSDQIVWWQVQVWDQDDRASDWSEPARWGTGLLDHSDWRATWIHTPLCISHTVPRFRRVVSIDGDIRCARWYLTARGLIHATIDGAAVSDDCLNPGWTDYHQRICYRCYDVTAQLANGEAHVLGLLLGEGWYKGQLGWEQHHQIYGDRTEALASLHITYADGRREVIGTDGSWRTTNSAILSSGLLAGEHHDATLEDDWQQVGYDDSGWHPVNTSALGPQPVLQRHPAPPVRPVAERSIVERWQPRPGTWILDCGQNLAGRVRLTLRDVPAGTVLRLRHGEMVLPHDDPTKRTLYTDNLRSALATDVYVARGAAEEVWEPLFTFHGFRYVELTGLPGEPADDTLRVIAIATDTPVVGDFRCSHDGLNQLFSNILWTQRANHLEIPTDCPQRDERLGWTGDAQAFIRTGLAIMDIRAFFSKWLQDLRDAQDELGRVPDIAPNVPQIGRTWHPRNPDKFSHADAAWADAATICPWTMWQCYGDTDLLRTSYPSMKAWCDFQHRDAVADVFLRFYDDEVHNLHGDWLNVDADTAPEILMTAFYAYSTQLTAQAARALGHERDAEELAQRHAAIRSAFAAAFIDTDGRVIGKSRPTETQTGQLLALHFDLVPEELRERCVAHLLKLLEARDWHLSTGFVGLPYLLPVLSRHGHADIAFRLLTNTDYPSWLYSVEQGATTIWERWNGWMQDSGPFDPGMNSYSHYAYGAVGEWLFADVLGIERDGIGFRHFHVRPRIGGGLSWAEGTTDLGYGAIRVRWEIETGTFHLQLTIPGNTTATVHLPTAKPESVLLNGEEIAVEPSRYEAGYQQLQLGAGSYGLRCSATK